MKYSVVLFALACFLCLTIRCQDKELVYAATPEIDPYVQRFQKEASQRGVNINLYEEGLVVNFGTLPQGKAGRCRPNDFPKEVTIDPAQWKRLDDRQREVLVFHELGHCILNRDHNNTQLPFGECASLMDDNDDENGFVCSNNYYSKNWRQYYLDELFNPDTPLPSWYQIPPIQSIYFENLHLVKSKPDTCFICTPLRNMYRVSDTLHLKNNTNFLISMTCQHHGMNNILRLAWNNIVFSYTPSTKKVEISKADLSLFNKNHLYLPVYASYPNNLLYRRDHFPALSFPLTFNLLKKDTMLYFYLNEQPIHAVEFNAEHDPSLKKSQKHIILSEASQKANTTRLDVYSF